MSSNKWVRSVSFNKTDDKDIARLKLIGKKSFSKYIKGLLDAEIKRHSLVLPTTTNLGTPQPQQRVQPPKPERTVIPPKPQPIAKPTFINPMLRGK